MRSHRLFALLTLGITCVVFLGWAMGWPRLVAPILGWPATVPSTMVNLGLMGLAIWIGERREGRLNLWVRWPAFLVLGLVFLGFTSLAGLNIPHPIQWIFASWVKAMPRDFPVLTSLPSLLGLAFSALTMIAMGFPGRWAERVATWACILGSLIPWVLVMGYFNNATEMVSPQGGDLGSAPFTTLAFVTIYLGLWSLRPNAFLAQLWSSNDFSGKVMRRVVTLNLLVPLVFCEVESLLKVATNWKSNFIVAVVWCGLSVLYLIKALFLADAIRKRDETIAKILIDKESLITKLETAQKSLAEFNGQLENRVVEVTQDLMRSNMELRQFAYVAAHDLQTPLRSIGSYVQLLNRRYADKLDDAAKELIAKAFHNVEMMRDLVASVLEYSSIEATERPFVTVPLKKSLHAALELLQPSIEELKAKIHIEKLPEVWGDGAQLSQLFQNLIGNALKYHGEQIPEIRVSAMMSPQETVVQIQDNGIGIDPKYQAQIFTMFKRLNANHSESGKGIGLAICERVVNRHRGRLWVESKLGEGSSFYFSLPQPEAKAT